MENLNSLIYILIALIVIAIIVVFYVINKNKSKQSNSLPFEIKKLLDALGGTSNISETSSSISKISIKLVDNDLVDLDSVKELGASGIVETKEGFTFIFGSISKDIEDNIKKKL